MFPQLGGSQKWILQQKSVCYAATGNKFGAFTLTKEGLLTGLKLVHVSGTVNCDSIPASASLWGCSNHPGYPTMRLKDVFTVITDQENRVIFPTNFHFNKAEVWSGFSVLGVNAASTRKLVYTDFANSKYFDHQQLRIWFTEDLYKNYDADNVGIHCVDVYARFA